MRPHFLLLLLSLAGTIAAQSASFPLDPRQTFMRTNNDTPLPPLVVPLASIPAPPGTWLRLESTGGFMPGSGGLTDYRSLGGVFASSNVVLATHVLRRVQDGIAAGPAITSGATYSGSLPTDFPEDFFISYYGYGNSTLVEVPPGASYLILGSYDSLYGDNSDPENDYGAVITVVPTPALRGTGEHVELRTGVNATPTALPPDKTAASGAFITAELRDPLGLAAGAIYLLAADLAPTAGPFPSVMPRVWLGPGLVVILVGGIPSTPGWSANFSMTAPGGMLGLSLVLQGGALQGSAVPTIGRNGIYESTIAHRIAFQ